MGAQCGFSLLEISSSGKYPSTRQPCSFDRLTAELMKGERIECVCLSSAALDRPVSRSVTPQISRWVTNPHASSIAPALPHSFSTARYLGYRTVTINERREERGGEGGEGRGANTDNIVCSNFP